MTKRRVVVTHQNATPDGKITGDAGDSFEPGHASFAAPPSMTFSSLFRRLVLMNVKADQRRSGIGLNDPADCIGPSHRHGTKVRTTGRPDQSPASGTTTDRVLTGTGPQPPRF
jgi:hypothetical protein